MPRSPFDTVLPPENIDQLSRQLARGFGRAPTEEELAEAIAKVQDHLREWATDEPRQLVADGKGEAAEFSLFGFGYDGLPSEVDLLLASSGAVERISREAIAACQVPGNRRRRNPGDQWATLLFTIVAWHNKEGRKLPPIALEALANVMGLVSYETFTPTPSKKVLEDLGLPVQIERWNIGKSLQAAKFDGEADAAEVKLSAKAMAGPLGVDERSIRSWRKLEAYAERRAFVASLKEQQIPPPPKWGIRKQESWVRKRLGPQK